MCIKICGNYTDSNETGRNIKVNASQLKLLKKVNNDKWLTRTILVCMTAATTVYIIQSYFFVCLIVVCVVHFVQLTNNNNIIPRLKL